MPSLSKALRNPLSIACMLFGSVPCSAAPTLASNRYTPVEQATFHLLQFADADVAVLKNVYPPHSDSGFHLHSRELFYIVITPARFGAQKPGGPLRLPANAVVAGSTGYNVMTADPFVHRVVNDDDRACHIVAIELRRELPAGDAVSARPDAYVAVFDNPRMRAWRLIIAPGQTVASMTQAAKGVRVVVRGGSLLIMAPGVEDQRLAIEPGDASIQAPGPTRALRNTGKAPIELIEIELK